MSQEKLQQKLIEISQRNPGALRVLMDLIFKYHLGFLIMIIILEDKWPKELVGSRIWIIYKDLCEHDLAQTWDIILNIQTIGWPSFLDSMKENSCYRGLV